MKQHRLMTIHLAGVSGKGNRIFEDGGQIKRPFYYHLPSLGLSTKLVVQTLKNGLGGIWTWALSWDDQIIRKMQT
jgi:hypothetical protein